MQTILHLLCFTLPTRASTKSTFLPGAFWLNTLVLSLHQTFIPSGHRLGLPQSLSQPSLAAGLSSPCVTHNKPFGEVVFV